MKKHLLLFFLAVGLLLIANNGYAQNIRHSWDGCGIRPNQHCKMLNLFINVIYDVHPDTNNIFTLTDWPAVTDPDLEGVNNAGIPNYLLDFMDTAYVSGHLHGVITRLYGESSFDSLQLTGDFVVVNVRESSVLSNGTFKYFTILKTAVDLINSNGGLHTFYGHDRIADYGNPQNGQLNYTNVLIRNITKQYGGLNQGAGVNGQTVNGLLIENRYCSSQNGTLQCVGSGDIAGNPTSIVVHEISHSLFGSNAFHTSGGNHRGWGGTMSFPHIQYGYGLMGSAGSGLVGCNGYERWRMHWKHPESCDYIAARNAANTRSIPADVGIEDGEVTFLLRDFATYGDAVRIQLPYKDSATSSNQYIWLENHQIGSNGKFDFLQYSNDAECRPAGTAGIYAYYQVGRDQLEGEYNQVWDALNRDNLKIIPAEGYYDYEKQADQYNLECVSYDTHDYTLVRTAANPFCGAQDQQCHLIPAANDSVLKITAEYDMWRKQIGQMVYDNLPCLGDTMDAFAAHTILNMGTNPSTCNAITCHSNNGSTIIEAENSSLDTRITYLSGLRIEMLPQANGDFLVNIRWNDYDITNDTRWTGTVVLKDTARLAAGKSISLSQNRTVTQVMRDIQTDLFASATVFTCKPNSYFELDSNATLLLTENSTFHLDSASKLILKEGATVNIQSGCTFYANPNADLILSSGSTIIVNSDGKLYLKDTMRLDSSARIIVRPGGKLIVDGGTLTSACSGQLWEGICVEGNSADDTGYMPMLRESGLSQNVIRIFTCYNSDIDTTSPNIRHCCGTVDYEYEVVDTVTINGKDYVRFSVENGYEQDVYLREDTFTGKLYRYYDTLNQDLLLCDMTLQEGDTFEMPNYRNSWGEQQYLEAGLKVVVNSVYQSNGRKVISFSPINSSASLFYDGPDFSTNLKLQFIEGIGPTYGLAGPDKNNSDWDRGINALLCASINDSLIYEPFPAVNCFYSVAAIPEHKFATLSIYPNPAHDRITLALEGRNQQTGRVEIIDVAGVVVWSASTSTMSDSQTIDVSRLTPGLYLVRYNDEDGTIVQKFVKE